MSESKTSIRTFLLARIEEDEELARKATENSRAPWTVDGPSTHGGGWWVYSAEAKFPSLDVANHVARQNPQRTLNECALKRSLIEEHASSHATPDENCRCPAILSIASVYAWHPEYEDVTGQPARQFIIRTMEVSELPTTCCPTCSPSCSGQQVGLS